MAQIQYFGFFKKDHLPYTSIAVDETRRPTDTEDFGWTSVQCPNPDPGYVYVFDEGQQTWVSKPYVPTPSASDKANAAILQTVASQKMAQDKLNSQVLLQLAALAVKSVTEPSTSAAGTTDTTKEVKA